jgi:hypothetical protein
VWVLNINRRFNGFNGFRRYACCAGWLCFGGRAFFEGRPHGAKLVLVGGLKLMGLV